MADNGNTPLDPQLVGNVGLYYYCCCRPSLLGWNVMPTSRNARGVNIIAHSRGISRLVGVQVKALSKRYPVRSAPASTRSWATSGSFNRVATPVPSAFVLQPSEVRERAHRGEKDGRVSYWLQPATCSTRWACNGPTASGRLGSGRSSASKCPKRPYSQ